MDSNGAALVELGDRLFSKKAQLDELWQTLAEQFYPERANFTTSRIEGDEYVRNLYESGPAQNRRDLAGAIGAILRTRGKDWFRPLPEDEFRRTQRATEWCDWARDQLRRMLYNEKSRFQKVMADGDDDFVSFGNALPIITENEDREGFLFELTHLRDNAWTTNRYGEVDVNHRKLRLTLRQVVQRWGEKALTGAQQEVLKKNPYEEIEIRHVLMPLDDIETYRPRKTFNGMPYASIYLNAEGKHTINEGGYYEFPMKHRRWRVPDDSVYGYSPAAMLGLVDSRVLQTQSRVILDAGELAVAPPLLAKRDAVLGGIRNYAGATTWIDNEYDERFGDAVRPLDIGGDVRIGLEMKIDTRNVLMAAWYLNKLNLPSDKEMTAYETSERIAEYIRSAGPVFEPFEADNARILDHLFTAGLRLGMFGTIDTIPPEIRGGEIKWEFDTPVTQAYARVKVVRARETVEMIKPMAEVKPEILDNFNFDKMARDTAESIGGEASWLNDPEIVKQDREARAQKMAEMEKMEKANAMLGAADTASSATQKMAGAAANLPQLLALLGQSGGQGMPQQEGFEDPLLTAPPDPFGQQMAPEDLMMDQGDDEALDLEGMMDGAGQELEGFGL